jgi:hypothetical protein
VDQPGKPQQTIRLRIIWVGTWHEHSCRRKNRSATKLQSGAASTAVSQAKPGHHARTGQLSGERNGK